MFIVMHCMGMPFNGATIEKESLGGSETAAYYIAKELAKNGHAVTLFTTSQEEGTWDGVRYLYVGEQTEAMPLGFNFHFYATSTPHDVCIVQRHPNAFSWKWASKVNLWWLHDLALYRQKERVQSQLWNIDGILTVSQYHKDQVCEVYEVDPEFVYPITNGVDLELFKFPKPERLPPVPYQLLYSSRPERGLEYLVKDGGIMDKLGNDYQLSVCAYENVVPGMEQYYQHLSNQVNKKDNCINLGSLTKQMLADRMMRSDLLAYPTKFEEVSCITAMEAMAAGLPMVTSRHAALPETCGSGVVLVPLVNDEADEFSFIEEIRKICTRRNYHQRLSNFQIKSVKQYSWERAVIRLLTVIDMQFKDQSFESLYNVYMHNSDYYAAMRLPQDSITTDLYEHKSITNKECYQFASNRTFESHYREYYKYEKERGVDYGPETLDGNTRFECVADLVSHIPSGSVILDYGCAHGHYTINLAKRFPDRRFVGYDIETTNIRTAKAWAKTEGLTNVEFYRRFVSESGVLEYEGKPPALIIAAEIVEHVENPVKLIGALMETGNDDTLMVITTPYGPWEAQGYQEHYPWRAHIHHLERQDLHDLWSNYPEFGITVMPSGSDPEAEVMGSYLTKFKCAHKLKQGLINYDYKRDFTIGRDTIALCMIVKDAAATIGATIESVISIVDEVIIAIDCTTTDYTSSVTDKLASKYPAVKFSEFEIPSVIDTGFDAARNMSIANASSNWILWLDSDEVLVNAPRLRKYLRHNHYSGFSIKQHHFSIEPLGVVKTDLPIRIFRNNLDIKFFGVVHEHPELIMNEGIGKAIVLPDVDIAHNGYDTEETRRARFSRNIDLLRRDREINPDRILGKFLWIRDLSQGIQWELESGGRVTQGTIKEAEKGIKLWSELLEQSSRMAQEALIYYSYLVSVVSPSGAIDYSFNIDAKPQGLINGELTEQHKGTFFNKEHARAYFNKIEGEKLNHLDSRYL